MLMMYMISSKRKVKKMEKVDKTNKSKPNELIVWCRNKDCKYNSNLFQQKALGWCMKENILIAKLNICIDYVRRSE